MFSQKNPRFLHILIRPLTHILFYSLEVFLLQISAQTTWTAWSGSVQSTMTARLLITGPKVV